MIRAFASCKWYHYYNSIFPVHCSSSQFIQTKTIHRLYTKSYFYYLSIGFFGGTLWNSKNIFYEFCSFLIMDYIFHRLNAGKNSR